MNTIVISETEIPGLDLGFSMMGYTAIYNPLPKNLDDILATEKPTRFYLYFNNVELISIELIKKVNPESHVIILINRKAFDDPALWAFARFHNLELIPLAQQPDIHIIYQILDAEAEMAEAASYYY